MDSKLKTLLVEFAPRGDNSRTKKIRSYFTDMIQDYTELEYLDLAKDQPDLYDYDRLQAYHKRHYQGLELDPNESNLLSKMDAMRDQLMRNDILILSAPVYNFGYPAAVKAWIDSVMQKGYVYTTDDHGHVPLLQHLKVCIIYTSGIIYDQINENENWNGIDAVGERLFEYMGASQVRIVHVQGTDMLAENFIKFRTENVAIKKLNGLATKWYGIQHGLESY